MVCSGRRILKLRTGAGVVADECRMLPQNELCNQVNIIKQIKIEMWTNCVTIFSWRNQMNLSKHSRSAKRFP